MAGTPSQDVPLLSLEATRDFWHWLQSEAQLRWERRVGVPVTNPYRRECKQETKQFSELARVFVRHWAGAQQVQPPPGDPEAFVDGLDAAAVLAMSLRLRQGLADANAAVRRSSRANGPPTSTVTEDAETEAYVYRLASERFHGVVGVPPKRLERLAPVCPPPDTKGPLGLTQRVTVLRSGGVVIRASLPPMLSRAEELACINAKLARYGYPPLATHPHDEAPAHPAAAWAAVGAQRAVVGGPARPPDGDPTKR
jgi:hypothetical protein